MKDYEVNNEFEKEAQSFIPLELRKYLLKQSPDCSSNRLAAAIRFIHSNNPGRTIQPKMAAYIAGMKPRYPRGISSMIVSIKKKDESFPDHVVVFKKANKKFNSDETDLLFEALKSGTISTDDL